MYSFIVERFSGEVKESILPEIARKDTTIFFNRCTFIKKLTPRTTKKSAARCKKERKSGKNSEFHNLAWQIAES